MLDGYFNENQKGFTKLETSEFILNTFFMKSPRDIEWVFEFGFQVIGTITMIVIKSHLAVNSYWIFNEFRIWMKSLHSYFLILQRRALISSIEKQNFNLVVQSCFDWIFKFFRVKKFGELIKWMLNCRFEFQSNPEWK